MLNVAHSQLLPVATHLQQVSLGQLDLEAVDSTVPIERYAEGRTYSIQQRKVDIAANGTLDGVDLGLLQRNIHEARGRAPQEASPRPDDVGGDEQSDHRIEPQPAGEADQEDRGEHTVGAIWRRERVSCPTRDQLGGYLLGAGDDDLLKYVRFHLEVVGCPYCQANLDDLRKLQGGK